MDSLAAAQYGFAPALASALLHSLWQDTLLALAAALALRAAARASAAARHNLAMGFLLAMVAVPAAQFLHFWQSPGETNGGLLPAMSEAARGGAGGVLVQASSPAAAIVVLLWLAGVGLMLARHVAGLRAVAAMERSPFRPLPPHWRRRADELARALGIAREVAVRLSDQVVTPCAARLVRPVIWLPLALVLRAPAEQVEALLAHELAHVARRDWLWNGVQCLVEALLFFHPAAWWLGLRIRREREHACDDLAVAACGDPVALAEALAALEIGRRAPPHLILAAHGGSLMHRIARLLSAPPSRGRWGLAALGALTIAGVLTATQIGLAGGRMPDLEVRASTAGPLGPGDYREIRAGGVDKDRFYRESLDPSGRRTETYEENGKARPIDAGVRRWLAEIDKMTVAPPPPPLPVVPRDVFTDQPDLIRRIAVHPDVVARLGAPAAATGRPISGNVHLSGRDGGAEIEIEMVGPKGRGMFAVEATMHDRAWSVRSAEAQ